jgi:PPP family 3-phenylpropionic acid transporter
MVVQPLIGRLSDKWDARKPLILGAAIVAAIAYSLFPISNSFTILLILSIFGTNGFTYLNTVSGVIIGRIAGPARSGGAYTRFRVLGSITYIIVAIVCGWLLPNRGILTAADLKPIFIIGPVIYILIGLLSTRIPDPKKGTIVHDLVTSDDASEKTSKVQNSQPMPKLIPPFLLAFAFYQGALYGVSANLPIYLTEVLHAKPSDLGVFFAFGVVTEVLVMFQVGKFTDRTGRRPALLLAFCLLPLRLIAYNFAPTPLWAAVVQSLHGLNFGIVGAIAIAYINDCSEESKRGSEQARLAVTAGIATAFSMWLCGWMMQSYGFPAMFFTMSAVASIGGLILFLFVDESHPSFRHRKAILSRRKSHDAG